MGRPRKAPEARRLEGNPGERVIPETAIAAIGSVVAPEHLDDGAKACLEMINQSLPPKTYASCGAFLLSAYATAWAEHNPAVEALKTETWVSIGSQG